MGLEKQYEKYYSCKRKRDFITFGAVMMFLLIVCFESYLMFILPIQLTRENAMRLEISRDHLIEQVDALRRTCREMRPKGNLQRGEVELMAGSLDILANYLRENQEFLSASQIADLQQYITRAAAVENAWSNNHYKFNQEKFDPEILIRSLEIKLNIRKKPDAGK